MNEYIFNTDFLIYFYNTKYIFNLKYIYIYIYIYIYVQNNIQYNFIIFKPFNNK